jgi:hypothetical protein
MHVRLSRSSCGALYCPGFSADRDNADLEFRDITFTSASIPIDSQLKLGKQV